MAADLAALKTRIASELNRSDLTTQIAAAIITAISFYRSKRFEFNELQATFNTIAQQESYTTGDAGFPTDIGQIDSARITVGGRMVVLTPENWPTLQAISTTSTSYGQPRLWSWYASKLFLYPITDAIYPILVSYQQRKAAPSADNDSTTVWTNQAEPLIRARTKKLICRDVTFDADGFARAKASEDEALEVLMTESMQLQDEGGLAPNW